MTYIGIDQSLTGFAAVAIGEPESGINELKITTSERGVRRLIEIRRQFKEWLDQVAGVVEHICMEGYANGAKFGREGMGEIGAITKVTLAEHFGVDHRVGYPTLVQPLQVKQFAGDTRAKKEDLKLLAYKKWGVEFSDNNLVDAYILARIAQAMCQEPPLAYERVVISKLQGKNEWSFESAKKVRTLTQQVG